ncbi:uncharacterized protein CBL_03381 [Carabus blaptoides fortunei]
MVMLKYVWQCMFSPRLNKIYGSQAEQLYDPSVFEKWSDQFISSLYFIWNFGIYTSPFLATFMYRRGYFVAENLTAVSKFVTSIGVILVVSLYMRGYGRANNSTYQDFVKVLRDAKKNMTAETKRQLTLYDFEFSAWPVEFQWYDVESLQTRERVNITRSSRRSVLTWFVTLPCQIISYVAVHTFGIRLVYPGSLYILQAMLSSSLQQGRFKLIKDYEGLRYKLRTRDNNDIDAMFVDRRNNSKQEAGKKAPNSNGDILVVCCEGNAGFYEIGIMTTPLDAGYSVLGWNHPGFGGSTGRPYPEQEQNAIDIIMQFAIHRLKFKAENIILFGWSIGGYTSTWAAMNYPEVRGLILDASFDDILPLAIQHMPRWWEGIVKLAVRDYINLINYEQLCRYSGPVLLIRRTDDEVLCTVENNISTNRGNHLLIRMLRYRYPNIFGDEQIQVLNDYLSANVSNEVYLAKHGVNKTFHMSMLESYMSENSKSYPMLIGEEMVTLVKNRLALFLAYNYMKDYKSTHCTPLPVDMFQLPWDIHVDNDYVFT